MKNFESRMKPALKAGKFPRGLKWHKTIDLGIGPNFNIKALSLVLGFLKNKMKIL